LYVCVCVCVCIGMCAKDCECFTVDVAFKICQMKDAFQGFFKLR